MSEAAANIAANLASWDKTHGWKRDGDEWTGQAALCGVPYPEWKASLIAHLIAPNVTATSEVIEIAPGHGRWSEHLIALAGHVTLVDISPNCLKHCLEKFGDKPDYFLTPGTKLPHFCDDRIDFIWSYDSFVHMVPTVIQAYFHEFDRALRPGGRAVIHHAGIEDLATHIQGSHEGWRSAVNAEMVRGLAEAAGLKVERQLTYWDEVRRIGSPRFGDRITVLAKGA